MAENGRKLSIMVGEKFEIYIRFFSRKHTRQKIEELKVKQEKRISADQDPFSADHMIVIGRYK